MAAAALGTLPQCVTSTGTAVRATDREPALHHEGVGFEKNTIPVRPEAFRRWILQLDRSLHALHIAAGVLGARLQPTTRDRSAATTTDRAGV